MDFGMPYGRFVTSSEETSRLNLAQAQILVATRPQALAETRTPYTRPYTAVRIRPSRIVALGTYGTGTDPSRPSRITVLYGDGWQPYAQMAVEEDSGS